MVLSSFISITGKEWKGATLPPCSPRPFVGCGLALTRLVDECLSYNLLVEELLYKAVDILVGTGHRARLLCLEHDVLHSFHLGW